MALDLYPGWKQAVKTLIDGGLTFGSNVSRARLAELCQLKPAKDMEDLRRFDLELLRCTFEIKNLLLTGHSMLLVTDQNGGYSVVMPQDQTRKAVESGTKALKREMTRMAEGVSFIRTDMLSDSQRAQNADAQAKISKLAGMVLPSNTELLKIVDKGG